MLIAALQFWNVSTSSLRLKCGMFTPTLLDVAAITSLKPTGEIFDCDNTSSYFHFDFKRAAFGHYIEDHHDTDSEETTDKEHVAFLTFWLSMYIFLSVIYPSG
jgi:predicted acetyltransferase